MSTDVGNCPNLCPNLSLVSLNGGCCLREVPRFGNTKQTKCINCPKKYVPGSHTRRKGMHWEDVFRLVEPGNPFSGVTCVGCLSSNLPPASAFCSMCFSIRPLSDFAGLKLCRKCRKFGRQSARKRRAKAKGISLETLESSGDENQDPRIRPFSQEEDQILHDGMGAGLTIIEIAAVGLGSSVPDSRSPTIALTKTTEAPAPNSHSCLKAPPDNEKLPSCQA